MITLPSITDTQPQPVEFETLQTAYEAGCVKASVPFKVFGLDLGECEGRHTTEETPHIIHYVGVWFSKLFPMFYCVHVHHKFINLVVNYETGCIFVYDQTAEDEEDQLVAQFNVDTIVFDEVEAEQ